MSVALSIQPGARSPADLIRDLHERVADWGDAQAVAAVAADLLHRELGHPAVVILRHDAGSGSATLLGLAPRAAEAPALGSRFLVQEGVLGAAVRERRTQRQLDSYLHPEYVRCAPGEKRSRLVVPACSAGEVRALVALEYATPTKPGDTDVELAGLVASQLAVAFSLANRSGGAADDGRRRREALVSAVAGHLAQSADLAAVAQRALSGVVELLQVEGVALLLRHPERQMLEVAATSGRVALESGALIPLDGSVPGSVARSGKPRVLGGTGAEPAVLTPSHPDLLVRDGLLVPLSSGGKTLGVLAAIDRGGPEPFGAEEVDLLQSVANQLGAVEAMKQVSQLNQRLSDSSIIAEVGRAVTGTLGLEDVLALVVQAAQMLVSAQCATVALLDEAGEELKLVATSGVLRSARGETLPVAGSLLGWVASNGESVVTGSVSDDPRSAPHPVRQGPGVVVPLESRGRARGALLAARAEGAAVPAEKDLDAMRRLASFAAIAIDNAQLYTQQMETARALRTKSDELERAYAELRESQERLVVSEKMAALGRLTGGIAHEINSPLGSILTCLQLSQQYAAEYRDSIGDPDVTADDHAAIAKDLLDTLSLAEGATQKVAEFVRTIKGQTRMHDEAVRSFRAAEEIEGILAILQHELRNRNVEVRTEADPHLELVGDSTKFAVILQNLISNAVDAYGGQEGVVTVRFRREEEGHVLEVEDRGCGIPEEIRGRIFDYLFTTKDVGQGTGLGLSMVHSIVTTSFNGTIDLRSEVGVGTTFVVRFPALHEDA